MWFCRYVVQSLHRYIFYSFVDFVLPILELYYSPALHVFKLIMYDRRDWTLSICSNSNHENTTDIYHLFHSTILNDDCTA